MSSHELKTTDNHDTIKKWVEERDGEPSLVGGIVDKGKGGKMLRIDLKDNYVGSLDPISWERFFEIFDKYNLEFLYQEEDKDGEKSKYHKFIDQE